MATVTPPLQWSSAYTRIVWLVLTLAVLWGAFRHPADAFSRIESLGKFVESDGGKILLLATMAMLFFIAAMGFGYYALDAIQAHTLSQDDVVVNMFTQFVTGSAFGTALGALITLLGVRNTSGK